MQIGTQHFPIRQLIDAGAYSLVEVNLWRIYIEGHGCNSAIGNGKFRSKNKNPT